MRCDRPQYITCFEDMLMTQVKLGQSQFQSQHIGSTVHLRLIRVETTANLVSDVATT